MGGFTVTIEDLSASATTFARLHTRTLDVLSAAAPGLDAAAGMAGDDAALAEWRKLYDALATLTWAVAATAASTLADIAARLAVTGNNYLDADRAAGADPTAHIPQPAARGAPPPAPPSCTGPEAGALPPELEQYWPGGHPDRLRTAAAAWVDLAEGLVDSSVAADNAFLSLLGANTGATFSAIATYWARRFESDGTELLFNAAPTTARALAHHCTRLAEIIERSRADIDELVTAAAATVTTLAPVEHTARIVDQYTWGYLAMAISAAESGLISLALGPARGYYLEEVLELVDALRRIDQAHLYSLVVPAPPAVPPDPDASLPVSLADVGEVVGLGLTGSAWDDIAGPHPDAVHLVEERREHILDSNATGGGHRYGTGIPGNSEFPQFWGDDRILRAVLTTARNPELLEPNGNSSRWRTERWVDGILIRVIVDNDGYVRTAHPVEGFGVVHNPP